MNIGFYFHVPAVFVGDGRARLPTFLGLFVAELAKQAGRVTLYAHGADPSGIEDFELAPPAVHSVDIGPMRSAPARSFLPRANLRRFHPSTDGLDAMLIRGPSALLPHLARACGSVPVALFLQADYATWRPTRANPSWRNALITAWVRYYGGAQYRATHESLVLVNSPELSRRLADRYRHIECVLASTVSEHALREVGPPRRPVWAPEKGRKTPIRLLFAGRIVEEKGLFETLEAMRSLLAEGLNVELELLGWSGTDPTAEHLRSLAEGEGLGERLRFRGYMPAGADLLRAYRDADLFILPSHTEGFPNTITEAMAAGVPVIATRVGGVPDKLTDGRQAVLIAPRSAAELAAAIRRVASDEQLRAALVASGWEWAQSQTNERSCSQVLDKIRAWVDRGAGGSSRVGV